jgi:hypothetical protein
LAVIFIACAFIIAKRRPARHFLHGSFLGLANSPWIMASHILLGNRYLASHAPEAALMASPPLGASPKLMMAVVAPMVGLFSGVVMGVLALLASKIPKMAATA